MQQKIAAAEVTIGMAKMVHKQFVWQLKEDEKEKERQKKRKKEVRARLAFGSGVSQGW